MNASLLAGNATYDAASDTALIGLLAQGENATLTLDATLPASAFGSPDDATLDLRHETRASYAVDRELAQVLSSGLTPEQQIEAQSSGLSVLATKQEQLTRDSDPTELLDLATTLENQTEGSVRAVLKPLDDTLNYARGRLGRFIDNYGQMAALTFEANRTLGNITASLNVTINESDRREALQNLSENGFPPRDVAEFLQGGGAQSPPTTTPPESANGDVGAGGPDMDGGARQVTVPMDVTFRTVPMALPEG